MPILTLREGRDNLDIRMSLFCSPASLTNSFSPKGSSISIQYISATAMFRNLDIELILKGIQKEKKIGGVTARV